MVTEETLLKVREAFDNLRRGGDLKGWELDDKIVSPFLQESGSVKLTICLLRGASERASIVIDPAATASALGEEIRRALDEKAFLSH